MKLTREEINLLALSQSELRVLNTLESFKDRITIQLLSQKLKVPRTTLNWTLKQLQKRNLVSYSKQGKQKFWYSRLSESQLRGSIGSLESISGEIRIFEGVEQMRELYKVALALHSEERVLIIEGRRAVLTIAKKGGIPFMLEWHDVLLDKGLILESVISKETVKAIETGGIAPEIIKSLSRLKLWVGYMVSDELIDVDAAVLVFRDSVIFADWKTERGVLVNNREIVSMMKNLIHVYEASSSKIDLAQIVQKAAHSKI